MDKWVCVFFNIQKFGLLPWKRFLFLPFFFLVFQGIHAQLPGHLFLLNDNFHAQIANPSYQRIDDAVIIAFPGLSGLVLGNYGNTGINGFDYNLLPAEITGEPGFFNNEGKTLSHLSENLWSPLVYVSIPAKEGRVSFYLKENAASWITFPGRSVLFFGNGNFPERFQDYRSGNINAQLTGYLEAGLGITREVNSSLTAGIRGKLLFGSAFARLDDWNFVIEPAENPQEIFLSMSGTGKLSVPYPVITDESDRMRLVDADSKIQQYLSNFSNPGLGFDAGLTWHRTESAQLTVTVSDIGLIWFRKGSYRLSQDESAVFENLEMAEVINIGAAEDYVLPLSTVLNAKGILHNVYRPFVKETAFVQTISPKLYLHYRQILSPTLTMGITSQTIFQRKSFHILSGTVSKSAGNFQFLGGLSFQGTQRVTLGAGLQWTNSISQFFVATDNLTVLSQPGSRETFSVSLGMNLLLNQPIKKKTPQRTGKFSSHRPFYRNYH